MANDKFLFVVSGAAGTGKDSVVKALREAHPEIEKTVSATAPASSSSSCWKTIRWWSTTSITATTTAP